MCHGYNQSFKDHSGEMQMSGFVTGSPASVIPGTTGLFSYPFDQIKMVQHLLPFHSYRG
jgi:protein-disulfide isomerase